MSKMQNVNTSTIKVVALTLVALVATTCLASLVGLSDYQARAEERQAILDEAQQFKSHPLVLNGCETDLECARLDDMLDAIHASYTLD